MILKKTIKNIFYIIIAMSFFLLVDFRDFSLKTVVPEKVEVKIDEEAGVGMIRNIKIEEQELESEDFVGGNQEIINLVNSARTEVGLPEVQENLKLKLSAMEKAQHMKDNDYFEHISPEGFQPSYFAQKQDYSYKNFGENLASGYFSAESVHEGWMNSPGHRDNILSEKFAEIGVAILDFEENGRKRYLIVQHFGRQLTAEDLVTKIVCDKESKENCEDAEDDEEDLEDLIEKQEDIIKQAKKDGVGKKDLKRLEENLDDLEEAEEEMEDYLEECEEFIEKCDSFK